MQHKGVLSTGTEIGTGTVNVRLWSLRLALLRSELHFGFAEALARSVTQPDDLRPGKIVAMANRAYLLNSYSPEEDIDFNDDGRRFYDSRWTMPLAWLFFFQANDLFVFEKYPDPNIRFIVNKASACIYFSKKRRLISQIVKHIDIEEILDRFINEPTPPQAAGYRRKGGRPESRLSETATPERVAGIPCGGRGKPRGIGPVGNKIESWNNGEFLILRPDEVWGCGEFEEKHTPLIKNVLEAINNEFATGDSVKSEIEKVPSSYIRTVFVEQERLSVDLIGCTYW